MPSDTHDEVIDWLLSGDVSVQFQTARDLLHHHRPDLQERIATEGYGAALLAARGPDGHWGRGFYQPKWTSSHYTLLELKSLGVDPATPAAGETVEQILAERQAGGRARTSTPTTAWIDACVNGMALSYSAYFGAPEAPLAGIVDFLLDRQVGDGGFNCRWRPGRPAPTHSSVHTTVSVLEGITEYLRGGYAYRADELADTVDGCVAFFLDHRLYRSHRTGEPMRPEFTRLHFPARWYFDILRCLDALRDAGVPFDARMQDALNVLAERRRPDGRWVVNRAYPGETHVPPPPAGQPDRWVTLIALRVLGRFDSCAGPRGDLTCHPSHLHDLDQLSQPSEVRGVAGDQRQPFG